ncbi:ATP-binding cassette domain-containing protein [Rhodohalobacter barkolensis]|uniref:ABC transporter ATP-binding protein n=1 Tax=Rhodohalobacter barkolensis TaxID=2053187 RepID=A0A2N0VJ15_9BACT|nr:ABC transporter ATP-binding protein [Rhodohalobacter barkolensis]PKD44172.1 ABC transporter ATP-binding protein [Rhodohalobacter barkolensis]
MISIKNLTKQYKPGHPIFSDFSKEFNPGDAIGIIGPNGSGKTTFLRILSVNSFPSEGGVFFDEVNIHEHPNQYLKNVGLVHDEETLPAHLTASELLEWILRNRNSWNESSEQEIEKIFDQLSLDARNEQIGTFSTGMKKKTQIAAALIHQPKILIMDEPLRGLDKETRVIVMDMLKEIKSNNTLIFMSSHYMGEEGELFDEMIHFPL